MGNLDDKYFCTSFIEFHIGTDNLNLIPLEIIADKFREIAVKYPISKSKGKSFKYTEL